MTKQARQTLREIARQLREYTRETPDIVANLQDHGRVLDTCHPPG